MDSKEKNIDTYPGDARSAGDKKATPCEVKEDVKELNNNPRNSDDERPCRNMKFSKPWFAAYQYN